MNTLECVLLLDRIASLRQMPRLRSLLKVNPCYISLILFLFCNLVQLPWYLYFSGRTSQEYAQAQEVGYQYLYNFTYCFRETFLNAITGRISAVISILIRDILMIFIEIFLTTYSIISFKTYTRELRDSNLSQELIRLDRFNSGLSKMSIFLSIFSILTHIFVTASGIYILFEFKLMVRILVFFAALSANIKYISNFFLFYYFNQSFHEFFRINYQNHEIRLTRMGL
jgi:hypothetical protein